MNAKEHIALEDRYNAHNYQPLDVVLARGEGVWVEDVEGKRYMDFLAAYSAVNQGHCHARLVQVMTDQAARLTLTKGGSSAPCAPCPAPGRATPLRPTCSCGG